MGDILKIEDYKNKSEEELEELAGSLLNQLRRYFINFRLDTVLIGVTLRMFKELELYKKIGHENFESLCCLPEFNISTGTANKYINIINELEKKKIKVEEMVGKAINNLDILRKAKEPRKYLKQAEDMPFNAFKDLIYEKELGINPEDDHIQKYIKKKENEKHDGCHYWKDGKCQLGAF